ncbi:LppU/SCO3897 family protein [Micromonospora sp. CA-263727]|uniref:LppU/SCO3897 family protein n=1 Tax=Micromonospora sp. CA-263727 TaxID=3239967 RepID=UPI003D94B748
MSEQVAPPPSPDAPQTPSSVPAPAGEAGVQPAQPVEPEKKSGGKKKLLGIVGALVAFAVVGGLKFGLAAMSDKDETAEAKAGDCIAELPEALGEEETKVDGAKVVACTDATAVYNVVGRVDGQTEAQASSGEACNQYFKEEDDGYIFYSIKPSGTGYLLCLTKKA